MYRRGQEVRVPDPESKTGRIRARFIERVRISDGTASGETSDLAWVEYVEGRLEGWTGRHSLGEINAVSAPAGAVINFREQFPPVYPAATHAPLYDKIEFCRDAQTLWGKIESKWDWLGVKPDGQFVVGYPRRRPHLEVPHGAYGAITSPGATDGTHTVRVRRPLVNEWALYWLSSEADAMTKFREIIDVQTRQGPTATPTLLRVQRLEAGCVIDDELVVSRPQTYR